MDNNKSIHTSLGEIYKNMFNETYDTVHTQGNDKNQELKAKHEAGILEILKDGQPRSQGDLMAAYQQSPNYPNSTWGFPDALFDLVNSKKVLKNNPARNIRGGEITYSVAQNNQQQTPQNNQQPAQNNQQQNPAQNQQSQQLTDDQAVAKIVDKVKGLGINKGNLKTVVGKYLNMVGKDLKDLTPIASGVYAQLKGMNLIESITISDVMEIFVESKNESELLEEGFLDVWKAKRAANKEGKAVDKFNKGGVRRLSINDQGKGEFVRSNQINDADKQKRQISAATTRISKVIFNDLKKLNIITSDESTYEHLINNFIRVVYILNNFDTDPSTGKHFTWTRVDRNLIGQYLRPLFEMIVDHKEKNR
jgi:hypothetical protein